MTSSLAHDFTLPNQEGEQVTLSDLYAQGPVVLYFYPKDMTSGCTVEACNFRDSMNRLKAKGVTVLGLSKDSPKTHQKFIEKEQLNFDLLSDEDGKVCALYGVWKEKSMYGRKYFGIERSTFLIGKGGELLKEWRNVKVPGHVESVLEAIV